MLKRRQQEIKAKGFNLVNQGLSTYQEAIDENPFEPQDYAQMRVGLKTMDNISLNLNSYKKINPNYGNKEFILRAIYKHDYKTLREISNYFFESNGIYYNLCKYLASMYCYDWYITPKQIKEGKENQSKLLKDFAKVLDYCDKSQIKLLCGNLGLEIIKSGVYYGIIVDFGDRFAIQQLPATYCRSRYFSGVNPVVELNLQFFDAYFVNPQYRITILKTFPIDIQKAYIAYKEGKLKGDYPGDKTCWVPLDPATSVKLSLSGSTSGNDFPPLVGVIPSLIDLDQAQELDKQKTMQQLLKIIVQKLPLDKNGDLIFDVDEARDIHNNAVAMLKRAIGIDVLTTFADIETVNTRDTNSQTTKDDLEKVERSVFNSSGISKNLFNADGNMAVANSILADEASIKELPLLFSAMLNRVIEKFNRPNHYSFDLAMLKTTQYNYKEMAKLYKEQTNIGFQKIFPQIALGHSQSSIYAGIGFENDVLHLVDKMIPPMSSNTMSGNLGNSGKSNQSKTQDTKETGRPEKDDTQKSDKTIQNKESMS